MTETFNDNNRHLGPKEASKVLIKTSTDKKVHGGRLPPPKSLRKCVLINNECKYSIKLPPKMDNT